VATTRRRPAGSGRKARITPENRERIIGALCLGADMHLAAATLGISRQALYKYLEKHPRFREDVEDARSIADDKVERALYKRAVDGDVRAQVFWLRNRRPDRWRERHELTGADGAPLVDAETLLSMARLFSGAAVAS